MSTDSATEQTNPTRRSFFSVDEEHFNYDTKWEAMAVMYEEDRLHVGAEYEEGEFEHADPCNALRTGTLLELADEWLDDNGLLGEHGEYFSLFGADASAELDQLIRAWHDKHKPDFPLWKGVGRPITHTVTAEDLAEFHAGNASATK